MSKAELIPGLLPTLLELVGGVGNDPMILWMEYLRSQLIRALRFFFLFLSKEATVTYETDPCNWLISGFPSPSLIFCTCSS